MKLRAIAAAKVILPVNGLNHDSSTYFFKKCVMRDAIDLILCYVNLYSVEEYHFVLEVNMDGSG